MKEDDEQETLATTSLHNNLTEVDHFQLQNRGQSDKVGSSTESFGNDASKSDQAAAGNTVESLNEIVELDLRELKPLPRTPSLQPPPPSTGYCRWQFDEATRVLYANFTQVNNSEPCVTPEDERYLLEMYERDDITVVSEGLMSNLDSSIWNLNYISEVTGNEYYHKFRQFDKPNDEENIPEPSELRMEIRHREIDICRSMKVSDYFKYLELRGLALSKGDLPENSRLFSYVDHNGQEQNVDVVRTVLYMIDYDMVKLLPALFDDFRSCFKLPGVLPGGAHCMMNSINAGGRPFMGPNLYVTPPASFTHFHQDGHGTVDSGHLCISGFNEVVMLRRMPELHKKNALRLLTGAYSDCSSKRQGKAFNALYNVPHGDGLGEKPEWPDENAIKECIAMNYYPSVFILKPGQHVHINKGRLHAFRKVSNRALPKGDCHATLRSQLGIDREKENLCISVAWDWMFRGVTSEGISDEITSTLECAALNRENGVQSLAIPELAVLRMARTLVPESSKCGVYNRAMVANTSRRSRQGSGYKPSTTAVAAGLLPSLEKVVSQHIKAMDLATGFKSNLTGYCQKVSVAQIPNSWEDPLRFPLDPYGASDFFCKLCHKELSNVYLHCDGCEIMLNKDFNICVECYKEEKYRRAIQMHPLNPKRHSTINHTGHFWMDRQKRCPCKNGPACPNCGYCSGCSCRCHTWFTLHSRFFNKQDEIKLVEKVKVLSHQGDLALDETDLAPTRSEEHNLKEDDFTLGQLADSFRIPVSPPTCETELDLTEMKAGGKTLKKDGLTLGQLAYSFRMSVGPTACETELESTEKKAGADNSSEDDVTLGPYSCRIPVGPTTCETELDSTEKKAEADNSSEDDVTSGQLAYSCRIPVGSTTCATELELTETKAEADTKLKTERNQQNEDLENLSCESVSYVPPTTKARLQKTLPNRIVNGSGDPANTIIETAIISGTMEDIKWTDEEQRLMEGDIKRHGWNLSRLCELVTSKTKQQISRRGRLLRKKKPGLFNAAPQSIKRKRVRWTDEEQRLMEGHIQRHGWNLSRLCEVVTSKTKQQISTRGTLLRKKKPLLFTNLLESSKMEELGNQAEKGGCQLANMQRTGSET